MIMRAMVALLVVASHVHGASLLSNGDLEELNEKKIPAHWMAITLWGKEASWTADETTVHSGKRSFRIEAKESTQTWLRSEPVHVGPGELVHARAWVKMKDVPAKGGGRVTIMAEFTNADGRTEQFDYFADGVVNEAAGEWRKIEGTIRVPALAATLRLRLGFYNSLGTIWWDDVSLNASAPLAMHVDLKSARVEPELGVVPVTLVNRDGRTDVIVLKATLKDEKVIRAFKLNGEKTQKVLVPLSLAQRGEHLLRILIFEKDGEDPIFEDKREIAIPPAIVLYPLIPTHWAKEDGAAKIEGDVDIAVTKAERESGALTVTLGDKSGAVHATWTSKAAVGNGMNRFALDAPELPEGEYLVKAEFKGHKAEQPWAIIPRRVAKTVLNKDGYLEHDGKAIFPLGIFNGGGKMAEAAKAGFTISHSYNDMDVEMDQRPPDQKANGFLDRSQKAGMKVLMLIPREWVFHGDWDNFRRRVRMFRNHPALLAWDEEEGIARGDMSAADLAKVRQIITEEDPNHPLMVGDSRDQILKVADRSNFFPLKQMDLGMWWWYPIPLSEGGDTGDALQGEEKVKSMQLTPPTFLTQRNTDKPIWVGVQAYKKNENSRYPNPTEYRAQAYIAIIHGAKGLMWYAGSVEGGLYLAPEEGRWDYLKTLGTELNGMGDVFMAPSSATPTVAPEGAPISMALKVAGTRRVVLAANRGATPRDVTIKLQDSAATSGKVLFENRVVPVNSGYLTDHFEPYHVHVYQLSDD